MKTDTGLSPARAHKTVLSIIPGAWILSIDTGDILLDRTRSDWVSSDRPPNPNKQKSSIYTHFYTIRMPTRWLCCRCDNGWTLNPNNQQHICGNEKCGHQKCADCEVRYYDMDIEEPVQDSDVMSQGGIARCGGLCSHHISNSFLDSNQQAY